MPESEARSRSRAKAAPEQKSRHEALSTDSDRVSAGPAGGALEPDHSWKSLLGSDFGPASFQRHAALLGDSRLDHPANTRHRISLIQQLHRDYGLRYVQRLVDHVARSRTAEAEQSTAGQDRYGAGSSPGQASPVGGLIQAARQRVGERVIQRLIRTPYPWQGVITPAQGANIRSSPDASDPSNILDAIPRGETVQVLSNTGNWLRVESRYRGSALLGYVYHQLVDDATSAALGSSVGTTMVWRPSGPGSGTDFESWASAPSETPFPAVSATTVMNCWEAVLLSAYHAGSIDWNWIHNLYTAVSPSNWVASMSRGANQTYAIPGPNAAMPQRGDLVFFDGLAHVALATGNGSEVYTFWPPPNTPFTPGGTTDRVKVFTIEDLVTWWTANMPPAPTVEFGAPSW